MTNRGTPHANLWIRLAAWLFPIVLWALATLLLRGDLGRWNDDYAFSQRIPETNTYQQLHPYMWGIFTLSQQIWRPLFFIIIPSLQTALWDAPWINHTLHALLHLGLCALVWRLLLRLDVSRRTAAALTLVYMTFPVHFQTLFWSACLTTVLATGIYVLLVLMYIRYAELPPGRLCSRGRLIAWASGITAVGTLIPLINEQPAAAVIALPFLHPAFRLRRDPWRGSRIRDLARALLPVAALLVMYAGYLYLYVTTSRKGYPATSGTFIDLHPKVFFARVPSFLSEMWRCLTIQNHWDELFKDGVRALKALGTEGVVWTVVVAVTGALWAWRWFTHPAGTEDHGSSGHAARPEAPRTTLGQIVAFGLMLFSSAWGVIYVLKVYQPEPRLFFMPLIGVAAILGKLADMLIEKLVRAGTLGLVVVRLSSAAIVPIVIGGAVILAGTQRIYHEVFYRDEGIGAQLRALVPEPQRAAFFLPVRVEDPRYRVGEDWFNRQFHQIFLSSYNLNSWIKQQMRNSHAFCGTYNTLRTEYRLVDERWLGWQWWFVPEGTPWIDGKPWNVYGIYKIPWDQMIPFKIDASGNVRLITEVSVQRVDNADASVRFPLVAEIAKSHAVPEEVATYFNPAADSRVRYVGPWKSPAGAPVPVFRRFDWDMEYSVTRLRASGPNMLNESRMFSLLPPCDRPSKAYFRASIAREDVACGQPPVRLAWTVGGSGSPAAELRLSPEVMGSQRRWIPVTIELPPHAGAITLEVSAMPDAPPAGAADSFAFVTEGYWEPLPEGTP